jgi:hypothetical protein
VAEDDELAQQLGYREDATEVDPNAWPDYQEGQVRASCQLNKGAAGDEWGPCDIFGGKLVSAEGWRRSWLARKPSASVAGADLRHAGRPVRLTARLAAIEPCSNRQFDAMAGAGSFEEQVSACRCGKDFW